MERYLEERKLLKLARGIRHYWDVGPFGVPLWITLGADARTVEKEWENRLGHSLGGSAVFFLDTWAALGEPLPELKPIGTSAENYGLEVILALMRKWDVLEKKEQALRLCAWLAARRLEMATLPARLWKLVPNNFVFRTFDGWGIDTGRDIPEYLKIIEWIDRINRDSMPENEIEACKGMVRHIQKCQRRYPLAPVYFAVTN